MRLQLMLASAAYAILLGSVIAHGQVPAPLPGAPSSRPGQTPTAPIPPAPVAAAGKTKAVPQVTLIGCVEREGDYRNRLSAGEGGVLGTGIDAEDEFVLTSSRPAPEPVGTTGPADRIPPAEANSGAGGGVYTLTGPLEQDLTRAVGRQVTIVGTIENAGERSTGADLTDVSDLPRIVVSSWRPLPEACPGK